MKEKRQSNSNTTLDKTAFLTSISLATNQTSRTRMRCCSFVRVYFKFLHAGNFVERSSVYRQRQTELLLTAIVFFFRFSSSFFATGGHQGPPFLMTSFILDPWPRTGSYRRATLACRSLLIANRFIGPGILSEFNTILRCSTANDHSRQGPSCLLSRLPLPAIVSLLTHCTRYIITRYNIARIYVRLTSFLFPSFIWNLVEEGNSKNALTIKDSFFFFFFLTCLGTG